MLLRKRQRLVASVMLVLLLASTASGVMLRLTAGGPPAIVRYDPYDLVSPVGGARGEREAAIVGARINSQGTLQVVVEGSYCAALTRLAGEQSRTGVRLLAFSWSDDDTPCPAAVVPWLVEVGLAGPQVGRSLSVGSKPHPIGVVDCREIAEADICRVGAPQTQ